MRRNPSTPSHLPTGMTSPSVRRTATSSGGTASPSQSARVDAKVAARNAALNVAGAVKVDVYIRVRPYIPEDVDVNTCVSIDGQEIALRGMSASACRQRLQGISVRQHPACLHLLVFHFCYALNVYTCDEHDFNLQIATGAVLMCFASIRFSVLKLVKSNCSMAPCAASLSKSPAVSAAACSRMGRQAQAKPSQCAAIWASQGQVGFIRKLI
jgi:hypothetical protein